ncbi:Non-specific serine/threonine protein kinase [Bertholletia excelsa]
MKLLLLFLVLLLHEPKWIFQLPAVDARPDPSAFPLSAAVPFPAAKTSHVLASKEALSPGTQVGNEDHRQMNSSNKLLIPLLVACPALAAIVLSLLCLGIYHRRNSLNSREKNDCTSNFLKGISIAPFMGKYSSSTMRSNKVAVSIMDYTLLESATQNFQQSNILGEGGFGCVYKAQLDNDLFVAVKRLHGAGQVAVREFETEVDLLSEIQHPNIISLLGYSIHGDTRLLVYELMPNGSLESQLHGPSRGSALTWHMRLKIALDTARGLEYLHEHCNPPVIHRDLKSSNILLDSYFNAKLSDFGLAIADGTQKKNSVKLSGTVGYVAPEYLLDGKLTDKSDVYAFGVVLLELLLGRKSVEKLAPAQCQSIVTWAMPQLTDRSKLPNIVDPVIRNTMDLKHLYQVAAVAVLCVQPEPAYRPLIADVLHSLIPLIPVELGGTLAVSQPVPTAGSQEPSSC